MADRPPPGTHQPPDRWSTGRLLSTVARHAERDWNAWLSRWDLNHASLPVLYLLARGPMSQRELALASGVTEQTMSRILARLERQGLIERQTHAVDRRRHSVVLTESGRAVLGEAGDAAVAEEMTTRGMSEEQVAALRALLLHMLAHRDPDAAADEGPESTTGPGAGIPGPVAADLDELGAQSCE